MSGPGPVTTPPRAGPPPSPPSPASPPRVAFTRAGVRRGVRASAPLLLGLSPFGAVVGLVSADRGLSFLETMLMSALVFAGASQLLALELWAEPAPVLAVAVAALVVNLRMAPIGAALRPMLDGARGWRLWGSLALLVDHSYALAVAEMRAGGRDAGFLFGAGVATWVAWNLCVAAGHLLAGVLSLGPGHPFLFAGVAAFVALLVPLWRGPSADLAPWALAAAVAVAASALGLPVPLPLLLGALSGAALGAWRATRERAAAAADGAGDAR